MYPKPDRSNYQPQFTKTADDPSFDIAWNEDLMSDGRPFRVECWAEDGMTCLTFFFSTKGLETASNAQLAELLEREGLVEFVADRKASALPLSDASGNDMWSVSVVLGIGDESLAVERTKLRPYARLEKRPTKDLVNPA